MGLKRQIRLQEVIKMTKKCRKDWSQSMHHQRSRSLIKIFDLRQFCAQYQIGRVKQKSACDHAQVCLWTCAKVHLNMGKSAFEHAQKGSSNIRKRVFEQAQKCLWTCAKVSSNMRKSAFEHARKGLRTCAKCAFWLFCAVQSITRAFVLHSYTAVSYVSVSGQWRPWSDCAYAQSGLGLRYPHMPNERFRMAWFK